MANEFKVRKGLIVQGSGSNIFDVQGSQGQLFSITDSLSGSLFSVNDISGIPIMEVFSDNTIKMGTFNQEAIIVSGSRTGMGTALPQAELHISGANNDSLFRIQSPSVASIMFVSGSGNVGIGTLTPTNTLNVSGTTFLQGGQTTIRGSGTTSATTALRVENSSAAARLTILDDGTSAFNTNHLYVSSSGNIGVGITTPSALFHISGTTRTEGVATFTNNLTSPTFISGWAGSGWRLDYASNQTSSLDLDNLTVRGQLRVFELVINQIRATNGSLFVSSVGKVISASFISGTDYFLTFDTASGNVGHGFARGDIIRAQRVNRAALTGSGVSQSIAGNLVYQSDLTVRNVTNLNSLTASLISGTAPSGGMDFVRLGNSESLNRQGTIYLTADDSYAPFIDVVDGVKSHSEWNNASGSGGVKVRMGKLNGITSPTFGPLTASGNNSLYGFWASGSAYLEGGINATFGNIAGWTINTSAITKSGLELNSSGTFFRAGTIASNLTSGTGVLLSGSGDAVIGNPTGHRISFIGSNLTISASNAILKGDTVEISGSNFHLINGSITASNALLSGTITANTGAIGGWNITSTAITRSNVELNSSNNFIRLGAVTNLLTGSGIYLTGSGEALIGSASGHRISFIGGNLTISASNAVLKGNTVEISGSNFHLLNGSISASNATLSGTITANAGRIGGFAITQDAITGSGFFLSGSATGDGFFISASNFNVKANGQVTGSNVLFTGGKVGGFTLSSDAISGTGFFLSGSAGTNDFFISSSNFNVKGSGTITASAGLVGGWNITSTAITRSGAELNSSNNFIRLGTAINLLTGSGVFLSGSGEALIGSASGHRISFISNTLTISASNATLKGNTVEISSSNFHLTGGNVTMTGTITANAGRIGGFGITQDAITGSGFFLSGSATGNGFFISASNFNVKANGQVTGSNVLFTGGKVGGFNLSSDAISGTGFFLSGSATGDGFFISASNFNVKANGQVTGSNVLFTGGKIGGFTLSSDAISGTGFLLSGSATGNGFFISASNFNVKANGTITASAGLIGGFNTTSDKIESTGSFTSGSFTSSYISLKANGQITGSEVLLRRLQSDGNVYTHFDTSTGIIDARNVGRVVISDPNEYRIYIDTTTTGSGATPATMSRAVKVTQAANMSYLGGEFTYGVPSTGLPNPSVAIPGNIIPLGSNVIDNGGSVITSLSAGNGWVTVNQHYVQLLQGENTFLLSFTMMGRINTAINSTYSSNNRYHDFRIVIATGSYEYVPTGGTSGNSTYNKFGGTQNLIISASTNSFYRAQAVGSNDTVRIIAPFFTGSVADTSTGYKSGVFPIPDTFQGKYVTLILQLRHWSEVNNYGNQTNGANFRRGWYGLETKIKGITLTATRQFTGRTSQGAIPLVTSSAPTFISSTG